MVVDPVSQDSDVNYINAEAEKLANKVKRRRYAGLHDPVPDARGRCVVCGGPC